MTAYLPARASEPLKFVVQFGQDAEGKEKRIATVETHNQEPIVVDFGAKREAGASVLVLTPYLVGDKRDLGRLLECKDQARKQKSS